MVLIGLLAYSTRLGSFISFRRSSFCSTGQSSAILGLMIPSQAGLWKETEDGDWHKLCDRLVCQFFKGVLYTETRFDSETKKNAIFLQKNPQNKTKKTHKNLKVPLASFKHDLQWALSRSVWSVWDWIIDFKCEAVVHFRLISYGLKPRSSSILRHVQECGLNIEMN